MEWIRKILARIKELLIPSYVLFWLYPKRVHTYRKRIRDIRRRGQANVVFLASNLAMWKYQRLFELLAADKRFNPIIILAPFYSYSDEQKEQSMTELGDFFSKHGIPYKDSRKIADVGPWLRTEINPDLIFYPQPYEWLFLNELDYSYHQDRLIAYVPYGALTLYETWIYNTRFVYNAWRIYYQSRYNKAIARKICYNRGLNVRTSGYISTDDFALMCPEDVWKPQDKAKKRIIWAPHFSGMRQPNWLNRGAFKWLCFAMQTIATTYKDTVQFAFKPHPKLLSELYDNPDWGKEKADAYYAWWAEGENTQLETGQFISLFKTSDAMIHDCNSFMADYLLTGKPVMFTADNLEETAGQLDRFGKAALYSHYLGKDVDAVVAFIDDVVLGGNDPKAAERQKAYKNYLLPPAGTTVAENIYNDLLKSIHFRK